MCTLLHIATLSGVLSCLLRHFRASLASLPLLGQPLGALPVGTWSADSPLVRQHASNGPQQVWDPVSHTTTQCCHRLVNDIDLLSRHAGRLANLPCPDMFLYAEPQGPAGVTLIFGQGQDASCCDAP